MTKLLKRLFAPVAALTAFLLPAAAQARAPQAAHPALWALSDADTTIYLFGTIHLLPDDLQWRTPAFDQAVASSQQLVVETIVDQQNLQSIRDAEMQLGFGKKLPPVAQRVPNSQGPPRDPSDTVFPGRIASRSRPYAHSADPARQYYAATRQASDPPC